MHLPKTVSHNAYIFFVSIRNFVCKMTEDSDLLMMLYDPKEGRPITESYVVRWSREGLAQDVDQINNLRVLFTVNTFCIRVIIFRDEIFTQKCV
jgi:dedicator of cytokinesis protein 1